MVRLFKVWVVITAVALLASLSLTQGEVSASSQSEWGSVSKVSERDAPDSYDSEIVCVGYVSSIRVGRSSSFVEACVFGTAETARVARYVRSGGGYAYLFARAQEENFHMVQGVCEGMQYCVYGHTSDVLMMQVPRMPNGLSHVLVPEFSTQLTFISGESSYYTYTPTVEPITIATQIQQFATGSVGVSGNGRWAIIELRSYGYLRVDLTNLTMRRIIAPGNSYGYGTDPIMELAISDDGDVVALVGFRVGIELYEINESCGDTLTEQSGTILNTGAEPCERSIVDRYSLYPGIISAHVPRFSRDGQKLSLYIAMSTRRVVTVISPQGVLQSNVVSYRAFGDSFTSGEGEVSDSYYLNGSNTQSNKCHVSSRSYPYLLGAAWEYVTQNQACSGSRIQDVRSAYLEVLSVERPYSAPPIISLGVGGNDVDLMGKLKTCLGLDTCEWASATRLATAREIQGLLPKLIELIVSMKRDFPESAYFIVGYPLVINADENAACSPLIAAMLNADERRFMNASIALLNETIKRAAAATHTQYVDIEDSLYGERLCDDTPLAMNDIRFGDDIAPITPFTTLKLIGSETFHPTPRGHYRMYLKIADQIGGNWQDFGCQNCETENTLPDFWTETQQPGSQLLKQAAKIFIQTREILSGIRVPFSFEAGTFLPGAHLRLEIHSTPSAIFEGTVEDDGSAAGYLEIPESYQGYHTFHAYSTDTFNVQNDLYQTAFIGEKNKATETLATSATDVHLQESSSNPNSNKTTQLVNEQDGYEGGGYTATQLASSVLLRSVSVDSYAPAATLASGKQFISTTNSTIGWHVLYGILGMLLLCVILQIVRWGLKKD